MVRIASFNVENLFSRPKVFNTGDWPTGEPILAAYHEVNTLLAKGTYSPADRQRIRDLLVVLDVYTVNAHGAVRRKETQAPRWAWLRKNRGTFDRQPADPTRSVEIVAAGRDEWIGWVELAKEPADETGTRMTAKVVADIDADIIGIVEAEDRPSLVRFNKELLDGQYRHVMLVDGNDERGIDVGLMTRAGFDIQSIVSNVDTPDPASGAPLFSRDCAQYELKAPGGTTLHVLVNHFKSQSGGGGGKRLRQATGVRALVDSLVSANQHVIVLGDLNEGPAQAGAHAANLDPLFANNSPLVECYSLPGFDVGPRPGTFDTCNLNNRLDYIFISQGLVPRFAGGGVFRRGVWGSRTTPPTAWTIYPEMTEPFHQASDHSAVFVDLNI